VNLMRATQNNYMVAQVAQAAVPANQSSKATEDGAKACDASAQYEFALPSVLRCQCTPKTTTTML